MPASASVPSVAEVDASDSDEDEMPTSPPANLMSWTVNLDEVLTDHGSEDLEEVPADHRSQKENERAVDERDNYQRDNDERDNYQRDNDERDSYQRDIDERNNERDNERDNERVIDERDIDERDIDERDCEVQPWTSLGYFASFSTAKDHVAPSAGYTRKKSRCSLCPVPRTHTMCTRYLNCTCRKHCTKRIKINTCTLPQGRSLVSIRGQVSECLPPLKGAMTREIRDQVDELFRKRASPSEAQFDLNGVVDPSSMPDLKKFQSRYRHYRASVLHEHNRPDVMTSKLLSTAFDPQVEDTKFFTFGFDVVHGAPQVSFGGTTGAFKVGVATKKMLRVMNRDPSSFVFHWDATYKINSLAYPVLICGITDPGGQFHPVAFFLLGEEGGDEYEWAMKALMGVFKAVVGRDLKLSYVMADAGLAPLAAIKKMKRELCVQEILMCFYHMVAAVFKRLGAVATQVRALVADYMFRMHYSRSEAERTSHWSDAKDAWSANYVLQVNHFVRYFDKQWLKGSCSKWQVYHTPGGFPTTNNPCELFNKHFKGIYTLKRLHGLNATLDLLGKVAHHWSTVKANAFTLVPLPSKKLLQRFRALEKHGLLQLVPPNEDIGLNPTDLRVLGVVPQQSIDMARAFENGTEESALFVELVRQGVTSMPENHTAILTAYRCNEQVNNVRHESTCCGHDQPWYGWHVKTTPGELSCECNYFHKHKFCCHLLFALKHENKDAQGMPLPPTKFAHTSRRTEPAGKRKRRGHHGRGHTVRRGRSVGPALALA